MRAYEVKLFDLRNRTQSSGLPKLVHKPAFINFLCSELLHFLAWKRLKGWRFRNELLATSTKSHLASYLITQISIFPLVFSPEEDVKEKSRKKCRSAQLWGQKVCYKVSLIGTIMVLHIGNNPYLHQKSTCSTKCFN